MWDLSLLRSRLQNKLRAMNLSYECLTPIIILPAFIYTAAVSRELSILVFLAMPVLLCVLHRRYMRMQYRSRFFFVWSLWSIAFGYMLFQSTVPMMEVLPEENIILVLFLVITVFLFAKTKSHAFNRVCWPTAISSANGSVGLENSDDDDEDDEEEEGRDSTEKRLLKESSEKSSSSAPNIDIEAANPKPSTESTKGMETGNRVYQCSICQSGVLELDHHSVWLDCCIGASNRKFFLLACVMAEITLLLEANLSLTSICHPYLIANIFGVHILMPDDCSDVYDQYDLGVCFVTSVYCLLLAFYVGITILYQVILISKGITATERKLNIPGNNWSVYRNWVNYIRN